MKEAPPGRQSIVTAWVRTSERETKAWKFIREQITNGRQCYIVCPRVQDDPDSESKRSQKRSAESVYEELREGELEGFSLGLLHGKLDSSTKAEVMNRFRRGE